MNEIRHTLLVKIFILYQCIFCVRRSVLLAFDFFSRRVASKMPRPKDDIVLLDFESTRTIRNVPY